MAQGLFQGLTSSSSPHTLIERDSGKGNVSCITICNAHASNSATIKLYISEGAGTAAGDFSILENPKKYEGIVFEDFDGKSINLKDIDGKIYIMNFWATWCAPCRREMPSLEKLTFEFPEIKVYAINMEKPNKLKAQDFFKFIVSDIFSKSCLNNLGIFC